VLVTTGVLNDESRLEMMYNQTGTIIAMTHILLPFMVLPLYSVMKTIPPTYVRAARSLGASSWTLNWSLAAALGGILLFIIIVLYWLYDKLIGIDNMKLG